MKKYVLFITGIVLPSLFLTAQETASSKALTIGDRVPDFYFEEMLNYKTGSARLSDFKDKVVILDFWATTCPPCIVGLVHLSSFQKEFQNDIMVMPIDDLETKPYIVHFLQKRKDIQLPTCYDSSRKLVEYFPHEGVPFCIVIGKDRTVKAITKSSYITKEYLQEVIAGKDVSLPLLTITRFDYHASLLSFPAVMQTTDYHSLFSGYLNGYLSDTEERTEKITKMTFINQSVAYLYAFALQHTDYIYQHLRMVFSNPKDSNLFIAPRIPEREQDEWTTTHTYCFELVVPASSTEKRFELMKNELDNYFGPKFNIHPHIEKRRMHCLKLLAIEDTAAIRIKSANLLPLLERDGGYNRDWRDVSMHDWLQILNLTIKTMPVINGSGYNGNISLGMNVTDENYLKELTKAVQKIGLRIEETEDDVEFIVF